ncbi:hypothetical protein E2C01_057226 [Portunus trituberculatus]|uniref:Uncharacterized protein n=1 Tax=Portunus trituberculatus TaxID=210409 RepID=A0A5B7GSE3_PORTR|nr:hypothetical protein [Portunus trituberculatus]
MPPRHSKQRHISHQLLQLSKETVQPMIPKKLNVPDTHVKTPPQINARPGSKGKRRLHTTRGHPDVASCRGGTEKLEEDEDEDEEEEGEDNNSD